MEQMAKDILYTLQSLSLDNIGDWPRFVKITGFVVCFVAVFFLGYFTTVTHKVSEINDKTGEEDNFKSQLSSKYKLLSELRGYRDNVKVIKKAYQSEIERLPKQLDISSLLHSITKLGEESGLSFQAFKPLPEEQREIYIETPFLINLKGTYHEMAKFSEKLAKLEQLVAIKKFSVQKNETKGLEYPELKIAMTIAAYRYSPVPKNKENEANS